MNNYYDAYGNVISDPTTYAGAMYDASGNSYADAGTDIGGYNAAGTYTSVTANPTTSTSVSSWLTPSLNGLTSLVGTAGNIYAAAAGASKAPVKSPTAAVVAGAPAKSSNTTIIILVAVAILSAILIVPRLLSHGK